MTAPLEQRQPPILRRAVRVAPVEVAGAAAKLNRLDPIQEVLECIDVFFSDATAMGVRAQHPWY